ncbi:hypothetical protein [Thiobacillus denitrificans]|nr:hypothetical protein [Thiobacillus denitrificans]
MKAIPIRMVAVFTILAALFPLTVRAAENPAFWKHQVKGEFATVLANLKASLEAKQFLITGEENLAKGLENNKQIFGEDKWNTIGFKDATSVHFCSLVFNQEVFNLNMDWSILCPFKLSAYTMKNKPGVVNIITVRPTYLLAKDPHPKAKEIGRKIENRIIEALREGGAQ